MATPSRVEKWWPKLRWLARTYQINVIHVPSSLWSSVCEELYRTGEAQFMGRHDHGFDLKKRRLFLSFEDRSHYMQLYREYNVERVVHEMAHLICQPPWCDVDDVGEDWMLMQVERCISRALFLPDDKRSHQAVVNWQEGTQSQFYDTLLVDVGKGHYANTTMWRDGMARGRAVGLLDSRNRPTWQMPDWRRMPKELRGIKDHQPPEKW